MAAFRRLFRRKETEVPPPPEPTLDAAPPPLDPTRTVQTLKPGFVWNPLRNWPRNAKCFCESGKKFKRCCALTIPIAVDEETAKKLRKAVQMKKDGWEG